MPQSSTACPMHQMMKEKMRHEMYDRDEMDDDMQKKMPPMKEQ